MCLNPSAPECSMRETFKGPARRSAVILLAPLDACYNSSAMITAVVATVDKSCVRTPLSAQNQPL